MIDVVFYTSVCMEYLTRILAYIGDLDEFKYFTGCSRLKVNHLSFADDLLLFSKGEAQSAYLLLQGLKQFSESSGLQANKHKFSIYSTAMEENEAARVEQFSSLEIIFPSGFLGYL